MAIYNLGTLGEKRPSDLADLSKYTGELRQEVVKTQQAKLDRENKLTEELSRQSFETQRDVTKQENLLARDVTERVFKAAESKKARMQDGVNKEIDSKIKKDTETRKFLRDNVIVWNRKDPAMRDLMWESPNGKQLLSQIKKHLPELVTDEGKINPEYQGMTSAEEAQTKGAIENMVRKARTGAFTNIEASGSLNALSGILDKEINPGDLIRPEDAKLIIEKATKTLKSAGNNSYSNALGNQQQDSSAKDWLSNAGFGEE